VSLVILSGIPGRALAQPKTETLGLTDSIDWYAIHGRPQAEAFGLTDTMVATIYHRTGEGRAVSSGSGIFQRPVSGNGTYRRPPAGGAQR